MTEEFQKIDKWIKNGEHDKARKGLYSIRPSDVLREDLVTLSDFGRRIKDPLYSLKILGKVVKKHIEKKESLSGEEIISYTKALIKFGLFEESQRWLKTINGSDYSEVNDLKGRVNMNQWDYGKSIYFFRRYLHSLPKNSYQRFIVTLNLSASLVAEKRLDEVQELLSKNIESASKNGHKIIIANSYELLGQTHIFEKNFKKGFECLEKSRVYLGSKKNIYHFYTVKWQWIADLLSGPIDSEKLLRAETLRRQALEAGYWEDVREIDRYLAHSTQSDSLPLKLYFGTIHSAYRKSIKNSFFNDREIPETYLWQSGPVTPSLLNIDKMDIENYTPSLRSLFRCLTQDFYRPISLGHIFTKLYPGEYFDPSSSRQRVYNLVCRLRKVLPEGLDIQWDAEGLSLRGDRSFQIEVGRKKKIVGPNEERIQKVREMMRRNWFTSKEVAQVLKLSQRSAQNVISEIENDYKLKKEGSGRNRRYRFAG